MRFADKVGEGRGGSKQRGGSTCPLSASIACVTNGSSLKDKIVLKRGVEGEEGGEHRRKGDAWRLTTFPIPNTPGFISTSDFLASGVAPDVLEPEGRRVTVPLASNDAPCFSFLYSHSPFPPGVASDLPGAGEALREDA